MKVGLVTFYKTPNYGAMLQAFALSSFLRSLGHAVAFVSTPYGRFNKISLFRCFCSRKFTVFRQKLQSYLDFSVVGFTDNYPETIHYRNVEQLNTSPPECDILIVGSDQVWNPRYCDPKWIDIAFLSFAKANTKKIAYAASFGANSWKNIATKDKVGGLLKQFSKISVREKSGIALVCSLSGRSAEPVIDPTLLYGVDFYLTLIRNAYGESEKGHNDRFVFSYLLPRKSLEEESKALIHCTKILGIRSIITERREFKGMLRFLTSCLGVNLKVPVEEWLYSIYRSDFVFTNSFHGVVFSVLFHKRFIAILSRGETVEQNERMISFLEDIKLEKRMMYASEVQKNDGIIKAAIDWNSVDAIVTQKRSAGRDFLASI